ncbi:MAG: hypothetical protein CMF46_05415 [Legionellales bacterium]|nr:hypothetical protein [Legionellales bacterium]|tara:strand:- start:1683 stop:2627 length:945 start_codon:yes stop_codon:yes gene_type:complete
MKKILFISNGHIGDAVLTSGILNYFLAQNPTAQLTVVSAPIVSHLFEDIPQLEAIISIKKMPYRRHWLKIYQATRKQHWSIVINMRNSGLSYLLTADKRYDFIRKLPFSGNHVVAEKQQQFQLRDFPWPAIKINQSRVDGLSQKLTCYDQIIAISPFTRWKNKSWPFEYFLDLIDRLTSSKGPFPDAKIAIFGGQSDRQYLSYFTDKLKDRVIDLVDNGHLLDKAVWIQHCQLYIGNDAGGSHMAAALNCPTVTLFGPTDARRYHPKGQYARFVQTDIPYQSLINQPNEHAMSSLSVDKVYQTIQDLLFQSIKN